MIEFTEVIERRFKILNEVIELHQKEIDKYSHIKGYNLILHQIEIARAQSGIDNLQTVLYEALNGYK